MPDILYNSNSPLASVLLILLLASLHGWILSNSFKNYCNITDGTLLGVGGWEEKGVGGGARWEAKSRLDLSLGLFGRVMSPISASHRRKRWLPITWVNFRPMHAFHVAPSMGHIVSCEFTEVGKTSSRKAEQSTKPGYGTAYVYFTNIAIT